MKLKTTEAMDFNYTELTALCEHLEQKEKEGYRLREINKYDIIYDKGEPRSIRYSAVIFNNVLMHTDFIETCKQEGWEYVSAHNELYIFRTTNPDATKIMTDEKEYFRTVTKRFLLNPRFLGFTSAFVLAVVYSATKFSWTKISLATNYNDLLWILYLVVLFITIFSKTRDFIQWYIKAKKVVSDGKDIPFLNVKERKINKVAIDALHILFFTVFFSQFAYMFLGYIKFDWLLFIIWFIICVVIFELVYQKIKYKSKSWFFIALSIAIIIASSYGSYFIFNATYKNNTKIYKEENLPISVADFDYDESLCSNEIKNYEGSRFAQYYDIVSRFEEHSIFEETSIDLRYEIFISDYPELISEYIAEQKGFIEEIDMSFIKHPDESGKWDEQYRVINLSGEITSFGLARKGNAVILFKSTSGDIRIKTDFFDVAYDKLFG